MPKISQSFTSKIRGWIDNFGKGIFTYDGKIVYCQPCGKTITCERKSQLEQHIKTGGHSSAVQRFSKRQLLLTQQSTREEKDSYTEDLCLAFISADIPFHKLKEPLLNQFLSKYTGRHIPDESTLRKKYLDVCYQKTLGQLKEHIGDNYVYLVVDETTDVKGNYVANLLVGKLSCNEPSYPLLLASKILEKTNHDTVCRFINDNLKIISNDKGIEDSVLLLLTYAAPYMIKSGKTLKTFYKNLIHVTCIAHALNRIAEKIRDSFPKLNSLINQGKKIFLKAPSRVTVYKEMMDVSLPPTPVLTRWGTWLIAALFYAENCGKYSDMIRQLKSNDCDSAQSLEKVASLIENPNVVTDLTFVKTHCSFLVGSIKKLETKELPLNESLAILADTEMKINSIPGRTGEVIKIKKDEVLKKNPGLQTLRNISKILAGEEDTEISDISDPNMLSSFKFAPITSVDVKRSFSLYKKILSDRRHNFTESNLEKYLFVNFNYSKLRSNC